MNVIFFCSQIFAKTYGSQDNSKTIQDTLVKSYDIEITLKSHFGVKMLILCHYIHYVIKDVIT